MVRGWGVDRVCGCAAFGENGMGIDMDDFTGLLTEERIGLVKVIVHDSVSPA